MGHGQFHTLINAITESREKRGLQGYQWM